MRKLVQRYYPQATLTLKNQTILFEFNTRKFMIHEPDLRGNWQDAYPDIGPQKGGIHGELDLRHGQYGGMAVVPVTVDKRYFVLYVTAPYSAKLDQHLYIHLKYPHDVSKEFREKFDHLVNSFDKHVKPAKP
jgi:hypothetical protein